MNVTFITGNQGKADFMARHLGIKVPHVKLDLDEIQSLDLHEIVERKARQAYDLIGKPVLVEDVGLIFRAMNGLPGPFIKWFLESLGENGICHLMDGYKDRRATARVCFAYFDGKAIKLFDGAVDGEIADKPRGSGGYGWDFIFIPRGAAKTYSEMNDSEISRYGLRTTTIFPQLRKFLTSLDSK